MRRGLAIYAAAAYLFLHLPLATLILFSFNASRFTLWEGFSLRWYKAVFTDAEMADAMWNSVIIAIVSTVISTIAGTLVAYALWKRSSRLLSGSLYLSLVTPEIVTGISLLAFFQWTFRWLGWHLGLHTVILAHVSFSIAYVAIVAGEPLATVPTMSSAFSRRVRMSAPAHPIAFPDASSSAVSRPVSTSSFSNPASQFS